MGERSLLLSAAQGRILQESEYITCRAGQETTTLYSCKSCNHLELLNGYSGTAGRAPATRETAATRRPH